MGDQEHNSWPRSRARHTDVPLGLVAPDRIAGQGRRLSRRERRRQAEQQQATAAAVQERAAQVLAERAGAQPGSWTPPRGTVVELPRVPDVDMRALEEARAGVRARSLPWRIGGWVTLASAGAWGLGEGTDLIAGPGAQIATSGLAGAAALAVMASSRHVRDAFASWRCYLAAGGGAAVVTATALDGPSWPAAALLLAGGAALSARWQRTHEVPIGDTELTGEPEADEEAPVEAFARRWHEHVAHDRGQVPRSLLYDGEPFDNGLAFVLQLAGDMTLAEVQGRTGKIASALGCDAMQLVIDELPADGGWRDASKVRLQYLTRSPITDVVEYAGPAYDGGVIEMGPYADGRGGAGYTLFSRNSMWSGVVVGSTGTGKSGLVNGTVASARSSGHVVTLYLDPKMNSSPELAATATVSVLGLERAEAFTRAVEQLAHGRKLESAALGLSGFTPARERPGYLVVVDECDMLFALPGMGARWGILAKTTRSLGIGFLFATHVGNISAFGGDENLRSSVAAGNVVLMRTATGSTGTLIAPGLPDPKTLPMKAGYGYHQAPDSRSAPLRAARLRSEQDARDERLVGAYTALTALQENPDAPLDAVGAKALGPLLTLDQAARGRETREEMARRLAAFLRDEDEPAPVAPPVSADGPIPVPDALGADAVVPAPNAPVDGPVLSSPPKGLTERQAAVWRALSATEGRGPAKLAGELGLAQSEVSRVLKALEKRGVAVNRGRGAWVRAQSSS